MELKKRHAENGVEIIELLGRFDAYALDSLKVYLDELTTNAPARIVVNLSGVDFVDSAGLATLVQGMKRSRRLDGDLHLCCLEHTVKIIFQLTRLDRAFKIFEDEAEAVQAFTSSREPIS